MTRILMRTPWTAEISWVHHRRIISLIDPGWLAVAVAVPLKSTRQPLISPRCSGLRPVHVPLVLTDRRLFVLALSPTPPPSTPFHVVVQPSPCLAALLAREDVDIGSIWTREPRVILLRQNPPNTSALTAQPRQHRLPDLLRASGASPGRAVLLSHPHIQPGTLRPG